MYTTFSDRGQLASDVAASLTDLALEILSRAGTPGDSVEMELSLWHTLRAELEQELRWRRFGLTHEEGAPLQIMSTTGKKLAGKVAVVTGASKGIGAVFAQVGLMLGAGIVEGRMALQMKRVPAADNAHAPDQLLRHSGRAADRHIVLDLAHTLVVQETRDEDGGVRPVELLVSEIVPSRSNPKTPALAVVQDVGEDCVNDPRLGASAGRLA